MALFSPRNDELAPFGFDSLQQMSQLKASIESFIARSPEHAALRQCVAYSVDGLTHSHVDEKNRLNLPRACVLQAQGGVVTPLFEQLASIKPAHAID